MLLLFSNNVIFNSKYSFRSESSTKHAPSDAAQFNSNSEIFASELLENLEEMRFGLRI